MDGINTASLLLDYISNYGPMTKILSDNATVFKSPPVHQVLQFYNVQQLHSAAYSPWSHGQIEKANSTILNRLRSFRQQYGSHYHWLSYLPFVTATYNITKHTVTGISPYEVLYGRAAPSFLVQGLQHPQHYNTPDEYLRQTEHRRAHLQDQVIGTLIRQAGLRQRRQLPRADERRLTEGDLVFWYRGALRSKLESKWSGPYRIVRYKDSSSVVVEIQDLRTNKCYYAHTNSLRNARTRMPSTTSTTLPIPTLTTADRRPTIMSTPTTSQEPLTPLREPAITLHYQEPQEYDSPQQPDVGQQVAHQQEDLIAEGNVDGGDEDDDNDEVGGSNDHTDHGIDDNNVYDDRDGPTTNEDDDAGILHCTASKKRSNSAPSINRYPLQYPRSTVEGLRPRSKSTGDYHVEDNDGDSDDSGEVGDDADGRDEPLRNEHLGHHNDEPSSGSFGSIYQQGARRSMRVKMKRRS